MTTSTASPDTVGDEMAELAGGPGGDASLQLALDIAGLGAWNLDVATGRMGWSDRSAEVYGGAPDTLGPWSRWIEHVHPEDRPSLQAAWQDVTSDAGMETSSVAFRFIRPDGQQRWIVQRFRVRRDAAGLATHVNGVIADETHRRETELRLQLALAGLQHRVRNILAVIRSISARTAANSDDLDAYTAHFDGRLDALARTQSMLARTADAKVDLEELVREELLQHAVTNLEIAGAPVFLPQRAAELLGLAIHELATNAVKFGALASPDGRVKVDWRVKAGADGSSLLAFCWREIGAKLVDTTPPHRGFGRELIDHGLPYQLGAETDLRFGAGGAVCEIDLPLGRAAIGPWTIGAEGEVS